MKLNNGSIDMRLYIYIYTYIYDGQIIYPILAFMGLNKATMLNIRMLCIISCPGLTDLITFEH